MSDNHDKKPLIGPRPTEKKHEVVENPTGHDKKPLIGPSGRKIVYDENGKPCRACNTLLDFRLVTQTKKTNSGSKAAALAAATTITTTAPDIATEAKECPPDVNELGRSSWTLLHSIAATYPAQPSREQQEDMTTFIKIFSRIYPCWFCAADFEKYITKSKPKVETQEDFGKWLCDAHNEVNVKLGKPKFDCNLWKQRWKDGWKDGSCD